MRILSGFAAAAPRANTNEANTNEAATSSCERIQISECYGIGYDLWVPDNFTHKTSRSELLFSVAVNKTIRILEYFSNESQW